MTESGTEKLFAIVAELAEAKISYSLDVYREGAISILVAVPGQRWEIDVFSGGEVDVEVFESRGSILDESHLTAMIQTHSS